MSDPAERRSTAEKIPDLEALWLPFTHNRYFKKHPRLVSRAEGMYYTTPDGRQILDAMSGLWCCNAGHRHPKIVEAVKVQLDELDYAVAFQAHHPKAFELANKLTDAAPGDLNHVFFVNSGSEAVDTALKIAIAYHKVRGDGGRFRLIGRTKGYHGVGFGGISVGGMTPNRKAFASALIPGVDHLPHTHDLEHMAFTRGQPEWGAHLAEDLERIVALHDATTIAAVIVEPMQGSAGVIVPPTGYLKRLREICDRHGILLIFDEVITAFGRLGELFSPTRFDVLPDIICFAKGVTSGMVPLGGALVREGIYEAFMQGPEYLVEFFHGYTYSGHPLGCAAAVAALDVYQEEGLFERARMLEPVLEDAIHSLSDEPKVIDVRNIGIAAAVEFEPIEGQASIRAMNVFHHCFDAGVMVRYSGDIIAIGPSTTVSEQEIGIIVDTLRDAIRANQ
ncbi:MAG: aspartate aminotransferase family protein [Gammaproteobacteria bacterium]|nr:aspartate aminotransferase family protein [Gammaproteobacteria bacterium]